MGVTWDILFIAATRRFLRWCKNLDTFLAIAALAVLNWALAVAVFVGPLLFGASGGILAAIVFGRFLPHGFGVVVGVATVLTGLTNAFDILVASAFLLLALLLLLHRLLWPLLNRPLYAIATHTGARNGVFLAVALVLLSLAYGKVPEWLQEILKSFVGG